jgi:hypothetical protein
MCMRHACMQVEAHHYCSHPTEEVRQCILFGEERMVSRGQCLHATNHHLMRLLTLCVLQTLTSQAQN